MTDDKPPAELPRRRLIELSIGIGAAAALAAAAPPQNGREAQGLRRQEDTMAGQTIRKHHPVAVVHYLYDPNSPKQPIGGLYYAHNGTAVDEIPIKPETEPRVTHVPSWTQIGPSTESLHFCSKDHAPMVYQAHNVKDYHWVHHSEGNPARDVLRLCVCEIIRPYSETKGGTIVDVEGHQPITWVDGLSKENLADPHNGVLKSFDRPPPVGTKCTLHYYHWMNAKVQAGETDRTAKKAETFTLEERSVTADIYIASQP